MGERPRLSDELATPSSFGRNVQAGHLGLWSGALLLLGSISVWAYVMFLVVELGMPALAWPALVLVGQVSALPPWFSGQTARVVSYLMVAAVTLGLVVIVANRLHVPLVIRQLAGAFRDRGMVAWAVRSRNRGDGAGGVGDSWRDLCERMVVFLDADAHGEVLRQAMAIAEVLVNPATYESRRHDTALEEFRRELRASERWPSSIRDVWPAARALPGAPANMWVGLGEFGDEFRSPVVLIPEVDGQRARVWYLRGGAAARWRLPDGYRPPLPRSLTATVESDLPSLPTVDAANAYWPEVYGHHDWRSGSAWLTAAKEVLGTAGKRGRPYSWDAYFAAKQAWTLEPESIEAAGVLAEATQMVGLSADGQRLARYVAQWCEGVRPSADVGRWHSWLARGARPNQDKAINIGRWSYGAVAFRAEAAGDPDAWTAARAVHDTIVLRRSPVVAGLWLFAVLSAQFAPLWTRLVVASAPLVSSAYYALWSQRKRKANAGTDVERRSWFMWRRPLPWLDAAYLLLPAIALVPCIIDPTLAWSSSPAHRAWIGCVVVVGILWFTVLAYLLARRVGMGGWSSRLKKLVVSR